MNWVRITVARTAGSAPRGAGTQMRVFADRIDGTIGGGALEWQAMAHARDMLAKEIGSDKQVIPLGPALGQCCGGSVTLQYDANAALGESTSRDIWIYGAGHVGRAMVHALSPLPDVAITWVDTAAARFPSKMPSNVAPLIATDPARATAHAPDHAEHLIVTYAHDVDLAICHALLSRKFGSVGLIGSTTKWTRFKSRLTALGHSPAAITQIACPIGDPSLGKHPSQIAIGVAAAMINPAIQSQKDQTA